jgi:hypothetical protein
LRENKIKRRRKKKIKDKKIEHRKIAVTAREGNERWRFLLEKKT